MASRTLNVPDDVEAALSFLGRQERPAISGDEYFTKKTQEVIDNAMKRADELRFNMITELMNGKDKGSSIAKLRELLGSK